MPDSNSVKIMTKLPPKQKRSKGRPTKRWADGVGEDLRSIIGKRTSAESHRAATSEGICGGGQGPQVPVAP